MECNLLGDDRDPVREQRGNDKILKNKNLLAVKIIKN